MQGNQPLFADCDGEECIVWLASEVANHPSVDQMPEGAAITSPRAALEVASAAASRAKARGSIDGYERIAVFLRDLLPNG